MSEQFDEKAKERIQEALERVSFENLPPEILHLLEYFSSKAKDESFIESLQKEIIKKYGE